MPKEVKFGGDARQRMLRGVDILANAVKAAMWFWTRHSALHGSQKMA